MPWQDDTLKGETGDSLFFCFVRDEMKSVSRKRLSTECLWLWVEVGVQRSDLRFESMLGRFGEK